MVGQRWFKGMGGWTRIKRAVYHDVGFANTWANSRWCDAPVKKVHCSILIVLCSTIDIYEFGAHTIDRLLCSHRLFVIHRKE